MALEAGSRPGLGVALAGGARRNGLQAALITIRPHQWIKNALVIAAAGAAGALGRDDVPSRVGLACIGFYLLSSPAYAVNDVRDAAEDRRHPRKRHRPVAAGELDARVAAGALFAYCIWAFQLPVVNGIPWRPLTILPFAACLHRYGALVRDGDGEAPEEVLLADRRLQVAALGWLVLFALGVNVGG